jgi:hypothetical protein
LFPVITIVTLVTIIFPWTINIQFYLERFYWLYGVTVDLVLLAILTVLIYFKKYNISFYVSIWFLLNFLLEPLHIGNIQSFIIFNNIGFYNFEIFVQILYYFIPISLILVLYNRMKSLEKPSKQSIGVWYPTIRR